MDRTWIEVDIGRNQGANSNARRAMKIKVNARWLYGALIIVLSMWMLQSFLHAMLAASVTAIASWPLYKRFAARLPWRVRRRAAAPIFTCLITGFVLAPLLFAFLALLTEARELLLQIAAADNKGIVAPHWLKDVPLAGSWVAERWQSALAQPGALSVWAQRIEPATFLRWAQSLGFFMGRQLFIILFTILVLVFLYQEGESLTEGFRRMLSHCIGERAEGYLDVTARAVRASANSMLVVGLFDGFATWGVYAIVGVPHAALWAAITGSLALVPFLGYVAVIALTLQLALKGAATPALVSFGLGCVVLFCGDKIVRPVVAREGTGLGFVWALMGCLGGFEVLGPEGLIIGPVLLTLARELWQQRVRDLTRSDVADPSSAGVHSA
jgi:predicted PurR-regulated permease PerM